jgi:hypothetical protein
MKLHFLLEPAVFRRIRKIAKTTISLLPRRPSAWNNSAPARRIFINFIFGIFRKCVEKIQVLLKSVKSDEYFCLKTNIHFWSYPSHFFVEWEMCQAKVVEKFKTHILRPITFFPLKSCLFVTMLKNTVDPVTSQMTLWRMRIACWIPKATNTHSEYVILIGVSL